MSELRTKPVIDLSDEKAVFTALNKFADTQPELYSFVVTESTRESNYDGADDDAKQGFLFEPTSRLDLLSQGLLTGSKYLILDRNTAELDIVPPISDITEHNRLLNLAASAATLAIHPDIN